MKKLIVTILAAVVAVTSGCGSRLEKATKSVAEAAAASYTFTGTANLAGLADPVEFDLQKNGSGMELELTQPESVAGMKLEFSDEGIKLHYRGLLIQMEQDDIPEQSFFAAMRDALSAAPGTNENAELSKGLLTVTGKAGLTDYRMIWDAEKIILQRIVLPGAGSTVDITGFSVQ